MICVAQSAVPPFSQKILSIRHSAFPCFELGMAVDPVHNRFAVPLDLLGQFLSSGIPSSRGRGDGEVEGGGQFPRFLCPPSPVGFGLLLHGLKRVNCESHFPYKAVVPP